MNTANIFKVIQYLIMIDELLNKIEKIDPLGDMVDNFEDIDGKRHTRRLIQELEDKLLG